MLELLDPRSFARRSSSNLMTKHISLHHSQVAMTVEEEAVFLSRIDDQHPRLWAVDMQVLEDLLRELTRLDAELRILDPAVSAFAVAVVLVVLVNKQHGRDEDPKYRQAGKGLETLPTKGVRHCVSPFRLARKTRKPSG